MMGLFHKSKNTIRPLSQEEVEREERQIIIKRIDKAWLELENTALQCLKKQYNSESFSEAKAKTAVSLLEQVLRRAQAYNPILRWPRI